MDIQWQQNVCRMFGLELKRSSNLQYKTGENIPLTKPKNTRRVQGDGNCLFRCFSYTLTGEERHHSEMRRAIVEHMPQLPRSLIDAYLPLGIDVNEYLSRSRMHIPGVWGTEAEITTFSHLVQTNIFAYAPRYRQWYAYLPTFSVLSSGSAHRAIYIKNAGNNYFEPVRSVVPSEC